MRGHGNAVVSGLAPQERLDSWKEIAAYLKRGTRTLQRWEREQGLPVHRLGGRKPGSVFAYKPELDGWWRERCLDTGRAPEVPAALKRRQKWIRMAVAFVAMVSVASLMVLMRS